MRIFCALPLQGKVKKAALRCQHELLRRGVRGRYVPESNLHLTMAFIGEMKDPSPIVRLVDALSCQIPLRTDTLGSFRNTLWLGLKPSQELLELDRKLREGLDSMGIGYDSRSFVPHITLVRRADRCPGLFVPEFSTTVTELAVFRSDNGPEGPVYTRLQGHDVKG